MAHYQTTRPRDNRVRGAARTGPQALMRKRHGNVTRTYKNGVLMGGPGIIDPVNKSYTQYDHCGRVFGVSYVDGSGKIRKAFQMTRKQYAQPCRRKK